MPKFEVTHIRMVWQECTETVEAENEESAFEAFDEIDDRLYRTLDTHASEWRVHATDE